MLAAQVGTSTLELKWGLHLWKGDEDLGSRASSGFLSSRERSREVASGVRGRDFLWSQDPAPDSGGEAGAQLLVVS